jgi:nicotinamidase-related amidase
MKIVREDTAALVIDFQEKLVPAVAESKELMQRVQILLRGLKALDVPMIVTQQYTKGLGMSVPEIWEASGKTDYLDKNTFSGFGVVEPLIRGKRYILVCGMEAHCCVLQTVIDLAEADYVPVLVTDCIGSRRKSDFDMAVKRAEREGAVLTTYEAVLFELLKEAGTPLWKEILKLIK